MRLNYLDRLRQQRRERDVVLSMRDIFARMTQAAPQAAHSTQPVSLGTTHDTSATAQAETDPTEYEYQGCEYEYDDET